MLPVIRRVPKAGVGVNMKVNAKDLVILNAVKDLLFSLGKILHNVQDSKFWLSFILVLARVGILLTRINSTLYRLFL
jgi:hypothetical protein